MNLKLTLTSLMAALSDELNREIFIANSEGRYSLTFDDISVELYQSHDWLVAESELELDLASGLNYQQEAALEKVMQQALINVRKNNAIVAINERNKLTLVQRVDSNVSAASFISMINDQVDIAEKYQQLVQQHTLAGSNLNNVWLP